MSFPVDIHTHHMSVNSGEFCFQVMDPEIFPSISQNGWFSVGIHPMFSEFFTESYFNFVSQMVLDARCLMIGECGLDARSKVSEALQKAYFMRQVQLSESVGKPLLLHVVRRTDELLRVRKELKVRQPWILHGFRGKPQMASQLVKAGFFLSFGEKYNEETLRQMPLSNILVETDDSNVSIETIIQKACAVRGEKESFFMESIQDNLRRLFPRCLR